MSNTSQNISATDLAEKQLSEAQAEIAALNDKVTAYETAIKTQEELVFFKDTEIKRLTESLDEAEKLVLEQQQQLAKQPQEIVLSDEVVTHKKAHYRVAIPSFHHKGGNYTADDLKTNSALVASLIESKSAVLVPVEK